MWLCVWCVCVRGMCLCLRLCGLCVLFDVCEVCRVCVGGVCVCGVCCFRVWGFDVYVCVVCVWSVWVCVCVVCVVCVVYAYVCVCGVCVCVCVCVCGVCDTERGGAKNAVRRTLIYNDVYRRCTAPPPMACVAIIRHGPIQLCRRRVATWQYSRREKSQLRVC